MEPRKILITGGAGFVGSCLADWLLKNDNNFVVVVDNLLTGNVKNLPSNGHRNFKFIKCNVNNFKDISSVMMSYNFDYVFHYAAVVGVNRTLENPVMVLGDIQGIRNVLDVSKNSNVKRVFFSSSSEFYGEPFEHPQNEYTTPLNSRLPYAVVKNVGEAFLRSYKKEYNLDYTIFRFFNTYGTKQSTDFVMSRFIALAIKNEDITIYGDGNQTRTFCFIDDNIEATVRAFNDHLFVNDTVNIGNNNEVPIIELAKMIIGISGSKSNIVHKPALQEGDMNRRMPDISKMKKLLGHELLPLEKGIQKVIDSGNFN